MEPTLSLTRDKFMYDGEKVIEFPEVDGVFCPIDGNVLYSVKIGGISRRECLACGAIYKNVITDVVDLRMRALEYLARLPGVRTMRKRAGHSIDAIFDSASEQGLLP